MLLTDTVGFIRKLPHHLVASFRATLEETSEADLLLHVIDASSPTWEEQRIVVDQVLDELGVNDRPKLLVFNKIDLLDHDALLALQERIGALVPSSIFVSTVAEGGLEPLRRALASAIRQRRPLAEIRMSPSDGKLLAEIHRGRRGARSANGGRSPAREGAGERRARRAAAPSGRRGDERRGERRRIVGDRSAQRTSTKVPWRSARHSTFSVSRASIAVVRWSRTDSNRGPLLCESSALTS